MPIYLESYEHRIDDIRIDTSLLGDDLDSGKLAASFVITPALPKSSDLVVKCCLKDKKCKVVREEALGAGVENVDWTLDKGAIQPWWPIGYGEQPLYTVEISVCRKVSENPIELISRTELPWRKPPHAQLSAMSKWSRNLSRTSQGHRSSLK